VEATERLARSVTPAARAGLPPQPREVRDADTLVAAIARVAEPSCPRTRWNLCHEHDS